MAWIDSQPPQFISDTSTLISKPSIFDIALMLGIHQIPTNWWSMTGICNSGRRGVGVFFVFLLILGVFVIHSKKRAKVKFTTRVRKLI
jgi:hypothetical protein